ncbi:alpha/beta hydrolase [Lentzea roselyniae]|uniref:alpha/beta fold hydrolase n=1 Tax=Lentzea roselyniae TaxID=531940 RepID=UPI0031FA051E
MRLHVHQWGRGPRVVLVRGGVLGGRETWRAQRPLTERWTPLAPDRPDHGQSSPARQDFEPEGTRDRPRDRWATGDVPGTRPPRPGGS